MSTHHIAILPGDGIGPEVIREAKKVLDAVARVASHSFQYEEGLIGAVAIDTTGSPFPSDTLALLERSEAILFGAIGDPKYDNDPSAKVRPEQGLLAMRKALGLFVNVRPVASYELLNDASPLRKEIIEGVDIVVYRELTGGIYFGSPRGRSEDGQMAFDTCTYSRGEIERVAVRAFEAARRRKNKLTMVDKANVLATSRLWREVVTEMAASQFPDVNYDTMFVDNAAMKLIQNPGYFDVILTGNLFGDILSDAASVLAGSLGMLPSASLGKKTSLFEPVHGSYPQAAGKGIANPMAAILSAAMLLEDGLGLVEEAHNVRKAVLSAMENGFVTEDIHGGTKNTTEVGNYIASFVEKNYAVPAS
ncbi:MAG: 3-isopropylmalate dehydrogenase [Bacteroidota bacterium]